MKKAIMLVVIIVGVPMILSCTGKSYSEDWDSAPLSDKSGCDVRQEILNLRCYVATHPDEFDEIISRARAILSLPCGSEIECEVKEIIANTEKKREEVALSEFEKCRDKASKFIENEKFREAFSLYEDFLSKFEGTRIAPKVHEEARKAYRSEEAKGTYNQCVASARMWAEVENFDEALKILADFPKEFADTFWGEQIILRRKEIEEAKRAVDERCAQEEKIPFVDLLGDAAARDWSENGGEWSLSSGVLSCETSPLSSAVCMIGTSEWRDYIIEMEFELSRGKFDLGVRGITTHRPGIRNYQTIFLSDENWSAGSSHRVRVVVRGDRVTVSSPSMKESRYIRIDRRSFYGPSALFVQPDSSVRFRELKVKHIERCVAAAGMPQTGGQPGGGR